MPKVTGYNILVALVVATGSFGYGFGFGVFITAIGQPGFYTDMNLDPTSEYTANILGAINALFAAGAAFGAIFQGWVADWIGRKKALVVAALCSLVGAAWTSASPYLGMLIAVRIMHGFGLGMLICLVPLYLVEVSPAHCRGVISGMNGMGFGIGYVLVAWVSVGSYYIKNQSLQWRLPLAFSCIGPLMLLLGIYFVPESPRYLCWIGRHEEALATIEKLHRDPGDLGNAAAREEYELIRVHVEQDKEQKAGYWQMFTVPTWRRRSLLVMFLMFGSQATGVNGISNYLVIIFGTLGLTGVQPLLIYAVYAIMGTIAGFTCCFTMDRFGRRRLILWGFPVLGITLLIEALLQRSYLGTTNQAGNGAAIAMIFLFIMLFQLIDAPSFVWCSEVFPTVIRAKGIGLSMFAYFVGFVTFSTPGPLAFRNIKWGMYLIYMGFCVVCEIIVYFYLPETRHRPVEQMGELFGKEAIVTDEEEASQLQERKV